MAPSCILGERHLSEKNKPRRSLWLAFGGLASTNHEISRASAFFLGLRLMSLLTILGLQNARPNNFECDETTKRDTETIQDH